MAVFALFVAAANAGVITQSIIEPIAHGAVLQGPGTKSTVVGPDGSVIDAIAPGGRVETGITSGIAAYTAPALTYAEPAVGPHHGPAVVAARYASIPAVHGLIPSVYGAHAVYASPITASGYPLFAPGSGLEGQYVHDYTEKLYDDGSYKGEIYH